MTAELLLGVDGGGTKTQALVTDLQGKVLARGLGPSSNIHNVGFDEACRAVLTAVEGALVQVVGPQLRGQAPGRRTVPIAAACFGLSGVDAKEDEVQVSRWVTQQGIAPRHRVVNDSELILAAGTPDGWGVALISGTGSVCLARSPEGKEARVGGWGPLLGDEGSGYHIASLALHLATKAADGRASAPGLLSAVLRHWSLRDATALIRHVHALNPAEIAGLATAVLDLSGRGDAGARAIVDEAGRELAEHVDALVRKLALKAPPVALSGSLLLRSTLRQAVTSAVKSELGKVSQVADPPLGAVVLARRLVQGAVTR